MSDSLQGNIAPVASSARPIDPGVTIGHVHLRTADIDRIRDFYVGVLGFDVVAEARDVPGWGTLGDALRRLREAEWPLRQTADHGTHLAIYITDPDGNDLELCWDRPFDEWPRDDAGHLGGELGDEIDLDALLAEAPQ